MNIGNLKPCYWFVFPLSYFLARWPYIALLHTIVCAQAIVVCLFSLVPAALAAGSVVRKHYEVRSIRKTKATYTVRSHVCIIQWDSVLRLGGF
jgi:hypothetical protein